MQPVSRLWVVALMLVACLLNVPATCKVYSAVGLLLDVGWLLAQRSRNMQSVLSCGVAALMLVACLLNVPATCFCISGTDLLRQLHVLPY